MHIGNHVLRNRRGRSGGQDRHGATPELVPVRPISPHLAAGAVLLVTLVAAACGSTPTSAVSANTHAKPDTAHSAGSGTSASAAAIRSTTNAALGTILVDSAGATLYRFTADRNGQSSCTGGCAQIWPPFTVAAGSKLVTASGLVGTFATTNRPDGTGQVTYNGSPLYLFIGDKAAGDASGQGVEGKWFVATVSAIPSSATPSSATSPTTAPSVTGGSGTDTTSPAPATPSITPTAPTTPAPTTPPPTSPPATSPPATSPPATTPPTTPPPTTGGGYAY
jgi:predicted lipoprotein with Yx(FWY)xxD motif